MSEKCYICPSTTALDDHHIDCMHGELSPETVPLCRRCHRTYHDLGLEWFEDEFLDKAIELENRRREIINSKKFTPPYPGISVPYSLRNVSPLPMVDKAEVIANRSDYWYEKHGLHKPARTKREISVSGRNSDGYLGRGRRYQGCMEPLCGKEWLANALSISELLISVKLFNQNQSMTIIYDGRVLGEFNASTKRGKIKRLMEGTKTDKKVLTR